MEKLPMCRVCLAGNVRMYEVVNNNLRELYEKLTDNAFVTEDSRPMLACFFCCTRLKQCYQFQRKCLEAEELFAQMMNEDYEPNPLINQDTSEFCNGFSQSPIVHLSLGGDSETENIAVKDELPAVCEGLDDYIEPKKEHQSNELERENQEKSFLDVNNIPALHSECDSEDDKLLMEFKIEVEEHEVLRNKRRASDTQWAPVAKKPKLDTRRPKPRDAISAEQKKNEYNRKLFAIPKITMKSQKHNMSNRTTKFKKAFSKTQHGVCGSINNTALGTSFHNNSNRNNIECISNKVINSDKIKRYRRTVRKSKKERFECDICQRSFKEKGNLVKHTRTHTGEKPFNCDICQHSFNFKSNLVKHTRTHTGEKPFNCDICQRSFNLKSNLVSHIRTHTGEKPFKCDICQRSFNQKYNLVSHTRTHTGEKPFNCDICQRSFNQKINLESHTRTHTGEKPFNCDICQRSFNRKSSLVRHTRTHTGEKPFNCDICQRSFNLKSILVRHTRLVHTRFTQKGNIS